MSEREFSLTLIFPNKDRIVESEQIRKKKGSEKTHILAYFAQCILVHSALTTVISKTESSDVSLCLISLIKSVEFWTKDGKACS